MRYILFADTRRNRSDGVFLRALRSFERDITIRYRNNLEQATLDRFWNR